MNETVLDNRNGKTMPKSFSIFLSMETLQQNVSYDLVKNLLLFVSGGIFVAIIAIIKFWTNRLWTLSKNLTRPIYIHGPDDEEMRSVKDILCNNKFKLRTTGTIEGSQKDALWIIRYQADMDLFSLIDKRKNTIPVIIYIPFRDRRIPDDVQKKINGDKDSIGYPYCDIVNSRIRLLNTVYSTLGITFN